MDVPQLKLSPAQVGGLTSSTDAVADLAHEISEMLRTAPHFVVVKADPREDRAALTMQIADVIADFGPSGPGEFGGIGEEAKKVSFNVVAIKPTRPRGRSRGPRIAGPTSRSICTPIPPSKTDRTSLSLSSSFARPRGAAIV